MNQVRAQLPADELEPLSEWERRGSAFTRGRAEGLEQGLKQGLEQGLEWLRSALEAVLEARGLAVDPTLSLRIAACSDTNMLRRLIADAATVTSAAELLEHDLS